MPRQNVVQNGAAGQAGHLVSLKRMPGLTQHTMRLHLASLLVGQAAGASRWEARRLGTVLHPQRQLDPRLRNAYVLKKHDGARRLAILANQTKRSALPESDSKEIPMYDCTSNCLPILILVGNLQCVGQCLCQPHTRLLFGR